MKATRDYVIRRPRAAAVRSRDCERCNGGWVTWCNEAAPIGRAAARYIRDAGGFRFTEQRGTVADAISTGVTVDGEIDAAADPRAPLTVFRFDGGQPCFDHPGPARFFAGGREHVKLADWLEDLDEHAGRLAEQAKRG